MGTDQPSAMRPTRRSMRGIPAPTQIPTSCAGPGPRAARDPVVLPVEEDGAGRVRDPDLTDDRDRQLERLDGLARRAARAASRPSGYSSVFAVVRDGLEVPADLAGRRVERDRAAT
jgi:hypothetical protein